MANAKPAAGLSFPPFIRSLLARLAAPGLATALLLAALLALAASPWEGRWVLISHHALVVLLIAAVVWTLLRAIGLVERRLLAHYSLEAADNLEARRFHTQARVLSRTLMTLVVILGIAAALLAIPGMRQVGAGLQIAIAQPIRIDDVVVVQGEWGRIEEITSTYIVVAVWDERRLVVPLRWFIENPFENWTKQTSQVLGSVMLWLDYRTPMAAVRAEFERLCDASALWDGRVRVAQVVDCGEWSMQVRLLVSASDSGNAFGLRCEVREGMLAFLQARHPESLPRVRSRLERATADTLSGAGELDEVARRRHEAGWKPDVEGPARPPDQSPIERADRV